MQGARVEKKGEKEYNRSTVVRLRGEVSIKESQTLCTDFLLITETFFFRECYELS